MRLTRWSPVLIALAMFAVACSGGGAPDATRDGDAVGTETPSLVAPSGDPTVRATTPGAATGSPLARATRAPARRGGTPLTTTTPKSTVKGSIPVANLYTAAEDRIGLTNSSITMCVHAALSLAPVFNVHAEDLNIYWQMVNEEFGGIYGRKVQMSYTDDNYGAQPQDVREAYEECKAKKPFILLGGIGFDQIPQVRTWAEQDHQLYIHHIAREDLSKKYSFSYLPSVETVGRLSAEWILKQHRGKKIGIIWRNSEHWEPGHKAFKAVLDRAGVKAAKDLPVTKNQSIYSTQINELRGNADVVWIWENALAATEIIQQADHQGYTPQWVVFPFNLMTDTLKRDTTHPTPVEGIATWPAYVPGKVDGPFARYADEIKRFEAAHKKYGRGVADDIVWMTWLSWKQVHQLLLDCGKDCTRNKVAGLLQSGVHKAVAPGCPVDFTRNKHVGGHAVTMFRAFPYGADRAGWQEVAVCRERF